MASNLGYVSVLGQTASLSSAGIQDARTIYRAIWKDAATARNITVYEKLVQRVESITRRLNEADAHFSDEVKRDPIVNKLRDNINRVSKYIQPRLESLAQGRVKKIKQEAEQSKAIVLDEPAELETQKTGIPVLPLAIGGGVIALAMMMQ